MTTNKTNKNNLPVCPDCKEPLEVTSVSLEIGDVVECRVCGTEVEVVSLNPVKLKIIEEEK
jgi:lysine biosynthesis protein LysW